MAETLPGLRYLGSKAYRHRVGVQLNKGEALHALRRFLLLAHHGQIRRRWPEDVANRACCLNRTNNAVIPRITAYSAGARRMTGRRRSAQ